MLHIFLKAKDSFAVSTKMLITNKKGGVAALSEVQNTGRCN